jgi:hypothetical protein
VVGVSGDPIEEYLARLPGGQGPRDGGPEAGLDRLFRHRGQRVRRLGHGQRFRQDFRRRLGYRMLGAYLLALMYWRRGGVLVLPSGFFPLVAAAVFAVGGLALVVCTFTGGPFGAPAGPGSFLSGALVALAVAAAYATRAWRRCRPPQMTGPFIWP